MKNGKYENWSLSANIMLKKREYGPITGLLVALILSGCMPAKPSDVGDCGWWSGKSFEISATPLSPDQQSKAQAALAQALAQSGFKPVQQRQGRFEALSPVPAVKYLVVKDMGNKTMENGKLVDSGRRGFSIKAFGDCDGRYNKERDRVLDSISETISTALQPYATERVQVTDFLEVVAD